MQVGRSLPSVNPVCDSGSVVTHLPSAYPGSASPSNNAVAMRSNIEQFYASDATGAATFYARMGFERPQRASGMTSVVLGDNYSTTERSCLSAKENSLPRQIVNVCNQTKTDWLTNNPQNSRCTTGQEDTIEVPPTIY